MLEVEYSKKNTTFNASSFLHDLHITSDVHPGAEAVNMFRNRNVWYIIPRKVVNLVFSYSPTLEAINSENIHELPSGTMFHHAPDSKAEYHRYSIFHAHERVATNTVMFRPHKHAPRVTLQH